WEAPRFRGLGYHGTAEVDDASREGKQHDQGGPGERYEQRRFERQPQPGEIEAERRLADAEAVHREGNHLDDERDRDDDGELSKTDRDIHAPGDRNIKENEDRLHQN